MLGKKDVLSSLIEDITIVISMFERGPVINVKWLPHLVYALTAIAAFSPSDMVCVIITCLGLMFAVISRNIKAWALTVSMTSLFSIAVALPALLGLIAGKSDTALFILKAISSTSILTGGASALGWHGLIRPVKKVLPALGHALESLPVAVYCLGMTAIIIAAAKYARSIKFDKLAWGAAIGDVLLCGLERGKTRLMAYEARSIVA